jgi:hypothetical protein
MSTDDLRLGRGIVNVRPIGLLAAALALATAPVALAASAPNGSHGQETDQPKGSPVILRAACNSRSPAVLTARPTTLNATAPKGSHGQETDQPRVQA